MSVYTLPTSNMPQRMRSGSARPTRLATGLLWCLLLLAVIPSYSLAVETGAAGGESPAVPAVAGVETAAAADGSSNGPAVTETQPVAGDTGVDAVERPGGIVPRRFPHHALANPTSGLGTQLAQTALMLALVLGGFLLLARLLKRLNMPRGASHPMLKVLAATSLGGKERVVVVQADDARLVLGVSAAGVSCLYRLDATSDHAQAGTDSGFGALLEAQGISS